MKKTVIILFLALLVMGAVVAYLGYRTLREPNVSTEHIILIPTGSSYAEVLDILKAEDVFITWQGVEEIAGLKKYNEFVKSGRYLITEGMSNEEVIDLLRSGEQDPVHLTFNHIHDLPELAGALATYVEPDSIEILGVLRDTELIRTSGFKPETFFSAFVPNTYEVWWNVDARALVKKLIKERETFWKGSRRKKAKKLDLTTQEVATLASIVRAETSSMKDAPTIAGVYLNRLRIGMPLQADPTLLFTMKGKKVKRVLDKDKLIDSPYNTYMYNGLPPGPINIPDPQFINAVLNYDKHKYLYFCADADLRGGTAFARTYGEHQRNARAYQRALDQQGTYR